MDVLTGFVFVGVFAAALVLYALGRSELPRWYGGLTQIREYRPPVTFVMEYEDERGRRARRSVAILRSLVGRDGRLYLSGYSGEKGEPRTFRAEHILAVATGDGQVIDTGQFLAGPLMIPPELSGRPRPEYPVALHPALRPNLR